MSTLDVSLTTVLFSMGAVGIVANSVSLSYFTKKQNKGLGNRLLILLNCCDLAVCVMYLPTRILNHIPGRNDWIAWIVNILFEVTVGCSAFSTCLVSVTRTIKVCRPFYSMNGISVGISFLLYFLCSLGNEVAFMIVTEIIGPRMAFYLVQPSSRMVIIVVVAFSTVITACCLLKKSEIEENNAADKRHATVTIFILSTVFCLLNLPFIASFITNFFFILEPTIRIAGYIRHLQIASHIALLLNSVVNPMIYLARKEEMRKFVSDLWGLLKDKVKIHPS